MGPHVPGQETRGGDKVDWPNAKPGEPLPERGESFPDPDSEDLPAGLDSWAGAGYPDPDGVYTYNEDEDGPE